MAVLALAELHDDYIIPIPFEHTPKETKGDEPIIVVVSSIPPKKNLLSKAYSFYGTENCKKIIGILPNEKESKMVLCVPYHCILEKACDLDSSPPPKLISPLWTKDRFGISPSEAEIMHETSKDMMKTISYKMSKFRKDLDDLEIKIDKEAITRIYKCETISNEAKNEAERTRAETRWKSAESVAQFLKKKFKVNAWVDMLVEPVVLFCVRSKHSDKQATIVGSSIEGVMNEIEPEDTDQFFDEYIYDASVFPIVMDVSFVAGQRVTTKKLYSKLQAAYHNPNED